MTVQAASPVGSVRRSSRALAGFRRFAENKIGVAGGVVVVLLIAAAIGADVIAAQSPLDQDMSSILAAPSGDHWFGTDQLGRDVFSRMVHGTRIALLVALAAVAIGAVIGSPLGMASAYYKGIADGVIMRFMDLLLSFPALLLALTLMAALGPSITSAMIAIGVVFVPIFARLARGATLSVQENQYIEAARATGMGDRRILFSEILPNILPPLIVQAAAALSFGIIAEASLSFLGLGAQPPTPSWGQMLFEGKNTMALAPWTVIAGGSAIFVAVLSFNLFGDGLRDYLDPRLRSVDPTAEQDLE